MSQLVYLTKLFFNIIIVVKFKREGTIKRVILLIIMANLNAYTRFAKIYKDLYNVEIINILDGGYILTGYDYPNFNIVILKTLEDGTLKWGSKFKNAFLESPHRILQIDKIVKLSRDLQPQWSKIFEVSLPDLMSIHSIIEVPDREYIAGRKDGSIDEYYWFLCKT